MIPSIEPTRYVCLFIYAVHPCHIAISNTIQLMSSIIIISMERRFTTSIETRCIRETCGWNSEISHAAVVILNQLHWLLSVTQVWRKRPKQNVRPLAPIPASIQSSLYGSVTMCRSVCVSDEATIASLFIQSDSNRSRNVRVNQSAIFIFC